jgi:DNA polymerase-1
VATVPPTITAAAKEAARRRSSGEKGRIFLIDTMGFIFRAHFAMARQRPMSTRTGIPTAATYVFVNMLRKLRDDFHPEYLAAVFDVSGPTFRDEAGAQVSTVRKFDIKTQQFYDVEHKGYKAERRPMDPDLAQQIPYIRRALDAYRIPILEAERYEADDVIGTLAREAADVGHSVYIVSSDKDMLQLVDERICVLNPPKDNLVCDAAKVEEILGVPPKQVIDVMALRGDKIDGIEGAPGIGDKGSVELIQRFGSVEAALDHAEEVQKKTYRESLQNNREQILYSKRQVTIDTAVPGVRLDISGMIAREPDAEMARALFTELEFTTLAKDFAPTVELGETKYTDAKSAADVDAVLKGASREHPLAIAVETAATLPVSAAEEEDLDEESGSLPLAPPSLAATPKEPQKVALSSKPANAVAVALDSAAGNRAKQALEDPKISKTIHDLKSAIRVLSPLGIEIAPSPAQIAIGAALQEHNRELLSGVAANDRKTLAGRFDVDNAEVPRLDDPMLYSYLLDPTYSSHALDDVALRRFNLKLSGSLHEAADVTGRLTELLRREVDEAGLRRVYEEIDLPLVPVLARMEKAGVKLDCDVLAAMSKRLERESNEKANEIYEQAGTQFNINSPRQLGDVLFNKLNLPKPVKYGKGKTISTAVDVLESLAASHKIPRLVLDFRQLSKLKSTYVDSLPALCRADTGRLHTTFNQTGAVTGRLSSVNPNLQNIPIRTELGREIRAAFIADPGNVLLAADYSQIELRLLAHFSEDPLLLEAYRRGDDIHTLTAAEVFGVPPMVIDAEHRRRAKAVNFGIVYGLSPFGLSQQLGIDTKEAKRYIDAYFEKYKGVRAFIDRTLEQARRDGKVSTLFGRVRPIPDINSKNVNMRGFAERTAVNTPLQGTAADLIKIAMIRIDAEIARRKLKSRMTLQVHDELVFEVPNAEVDTMKALVRDQMESAHKLRVPLLVELGVGPNWRDLD